MHCVKCQSTIQRISSLITKTWPTRCGWLSHGVYQRIEWELLSQELQRYTDIIHSQYAEIANHFGTPAGINAAPLSPTSQCFPSCLAFLPWFQVPCADTYEFFFCFIGFDRVSPFFNHRESSHDKLFIQSFSIWIRVLCAFVVHCEAQYRNPSGIIYWYSSFSRKDFNAWAEIQNV